MKQLEGFVLGKEYTDFPKRDDILLKWSLIKQYKTSSVIAWFWLKAEMPEDMHWGE